MAEGALALASAPQRRDGVEEHPAVPECRDAKHLQVLSRQALKDRFVYLVFAECSLILSEAKAPQPDHDVHDDARASAWSIALLERLGEGLMAEVSGLVRTSVRNAKALQTVAGTAI